MPLVSIVCVCAFTYSDLNNMHTDFVRKDTTIGVPTCMWVCCCVNIHVGMPIVFFLLNRCVYMWVCFFFCVFDSVRLLSYSIP